MKGALTPHAPQRAPMRAGSAGLALWDSGAGLGGGAGVGGAPGPAPASFHGTWRTTSYHPAHLARPPRPPRVHLVTARVHRR
jgi:hypothetical protein